jgi:hypothetical protein
VRRDVRLVKRRRVQHGVDTLHAAANEGTVGNRADSVGERRRGDIGAASGVAMPRQDAHQRFAEMSGAARHE